MAGRPKLHPSNNDKFARYVHRQIHGDPIANFDALSASEQEIMREHYKRYSKPKLTKIAIKPDVAHDFKLRAEAEGLTNTELLRKLLDETATPEITEAMGLINADQMDRILADVKAVERDVT